MNIIYVVISCTAVDYEHSLFFAVILFLLRSIFIVVVYIDAVFFCKPVNSFRKAVAFDLLNKGNYIATGVARTEAMPCTALAVNKKRWCLFRMERTACLIISTLVFKVNKFTDYINDVGS